MPTARAADWCCAGGRGLSGVDPDFTAVREAVVLELLSGSPVPAPRLVAADPDGAACASRRCSSPAFPGALPGFPGTCARFSHSLPRRSCHTRPRRSGPGAACGLSELPRRALHQAAAVVDAVEPLGPCNRNRFSRSSAGPPLLHPPRLPAREHPLVVRPADRDRGLDDRLLGTGGRRYRPPALKPRAHVRPGRRQGVPASAPRIRPRGVRRPALLGRRYGPRRRV
jgi:hypothetical protein